MRSIIDDYEERQRKESGKGNFIERKYNQFKDEREQYKKAYAAARSEAIVAKAKSDATKKVFRKDLRESGKKLGSGVKKQLGSVAKNLRNRYKW